MSSSVEDIPDIASEHTEALSEDCRLEKDSSNDADMFEDSSGEESQATCGIEDANETSAILHSKDSDVAVPKDVLLNDPVSIYDDGQESLMDMTKEEQDYFDRYKAANQAQLSSLKCTICSCQLFLVSPENIRIHPALGVLVCKNCREFYSNGPFTKDEDGHDEYCRWCAEGGMMICCDTCSNVFCKACLRRCVGRVALLEITTIKSSWSCLVCNNLPLWAQRALSRMVLVAIKAPSNRKSLSGRSLLNSPAMVDTSDPAVWLPLMISEAEKLATYCKVLASKVGNNWHKEDGTSNRIEASENSRSKKEMDKLKVVSCCRKLRKAVVTTRLNMKLLEKKLVNKFEQKYGTAVDIDVETRPAEASSSKEDSTPRCGKRLIVKIKNFREANRKQDFYAEIRNSPIPPSSSNTRPTPSSSPPKSDGSISSLATLPVAGSPLPTIQNQDDDNSSTEAPHIQEDEYILPNEEEPHLSADNDQFFDSQSELIDDKPTETINPLEVDEPESPAEERESNISLDNTLKPAHLGETSASPKSLSLRMSPASNGVSNNDLSQRSGCSTPPPVLSKNDLTKIPSDQEVRRSKKHSETDGSKVNKLKLAARTPSANENADRNLKRVSNEETSPSSESVETTNSKSFHLTSTPISDLNEKARQELLKGSDSDDSLDEIKLSPRVKRTKKRIRVPLLGLDDPKLKAECAVVVSRITNLDEALAMESAKLTESKEAALSKEINRLVKNPVQMTSKGSSESEDEDLLNVKKTKKFVSKSKKENPVKTEFNLYNLESSDSESDSPIQTPGASKLAAMTSLPDRNEAVRQALLASSDSEAEFGVDMLDDVNFANEDVREEIVGGDDVIEMEVGSSPLLKLEPSTEDEDGDNDENVDTKSSALKTSKLLRVSLGDPEAETDDSKSTKGSKGDKKKKKIDRKKRRINSDSDFESSGSEKKKKKSKRKRGSPSDVEDISDDENDSDDETNSKPKRRRRIKKTASSDSNDSDDSDIQVLNESQRSEASGAKGRKNIKKIIKDTNLKDETKAAAKEEEDRKRRIAERQKFYNEAFVGDLALINAQIDHLVLDFDPKTKEELVTVDKQIVTKLKPHQVKGVKFMWDACFESIERIKEHPGSGCILAHCMGLGKSLQVVTLVHTVLTHKACQVDRVLVVCPLSTVLNWVNEFKVWLPPDNDVEVYELASVKAKDLRVYTLRNWFESGGVMIIGYDMYRNLTNENNKRIKTKARDVFMRSLVDPGPQLVVCDEGHLLKNEATALSKAMQRIATRRRVVLTGTPLQNSLLEYHCMIQFVKPNLLGTKKEFTNRFANPIKNGQAADSTDGDVRIMKRRAHVLHKMLEDSVQRFDYAVLTPFLPPKHEYVVSVKMSELQIKMYQYYLEHHAKGGPGRRGKGAGLFADFQELGRVWTHPKALLLAGISRDSKAKFHSDSEGSLADFIDDHVESPMTEEDGGVVCLDESDDEKGSENEEGAGKTNAWKSRTRAGRGDQPPPEDELGVTTPMTGSWWSQFVTDEDMIKMEHSGKLILLMDILRQCELIGDKVLVFSQSLVSLNLIEEFLAVEDSQNETNRANLSKELKQEKLEATGTWRLNADYFRLDGQTSPELRKNWCNAFNNPSNLRSRLFLISTKAGGLGINLVAANRVIIFDASWNPSHDVQSIFRVYRFGQKKPCYIYRFLAQGTMEEKIYDRQVTKLSLSCRVVDEQQIERHFNSADLNELYVFEPDSHLRRPTPLLPKDRLLAELTIQRKDWIVTYHEHDSLLENKSDEELTEAERKAAWDDFENEKRGVNTMGMMMHESPGFMGMPGMPDILGGLAGRSVAGIPLSSIAAMIYNSNPGITQDEFLGRLRLTVDQLQNFSVQQAAAAAASAAAASAQNSLQQPGDAQRLLMQRQVAADQLKRQFGNTPQPPGLPGPSGVTTPPAVPRSRGRPTIGPHQRTDLYGLAPVIYNSATTATQQAGPSGSSSVPKT